MKRMWIVAALALISVEVSLPARALDNDADATIAALQTRVAELETKPTSTPAPTKAPTSTPKPKAPTSTPRPKTPTPSPTPTIDEVVADYPPIPDIRELAIRPGSLVGEKIAFSGTVRTIKVAPPGKVFVLGDSDPQDFESELQIEVPAPDGSTEYVFVGYDGDTEGVFEGTYVTVYGTAMGTATFQNAMGGEITQPLVDAKLVTIA